VSDEVLAATTGAMTDGTALEMTVETIAGKAAAAVMTGTAVATIIGTAGATTGTIGVTGAMTAETTARRTAGTIAAMTVGVAETTAARSAIAAATGGMIVAARVLETLRKMPRS